MTQRIDERDWQWYGNAGHYICGRWCRFHMTTEVGDVLVSTVGELLHPSNVGNSERTEREWLMDNWPGADVGRGRKYETMVFRIMREESGDKVRCESPEPEACDCGLPKIEGDPLLVLGCNRPGLARKNHMEACQLYAARGGKAEPTGEQVASQPTGSEATGPGSPP